MEQWKNYGDINFLDWGGCLVRPVDNGYEVISLTTEIPDCEDRFKDPCIAAKCYVDLEGWLEDLTDNTGMIDQFNSFCGYDDDYRPLTEDERMQYCVDLVDYFGIQEFGPELPDETRCNPYAAGTAGDWIVEKNTAEKFLREYGVSDEILR